jgi:long-chain fatty acid transport protein
MFSIAAAQQVIPSLRLLADFTWTGWSSIEDLDIFRASGTGLTSTPLEFEDSWRVGLGAEYQLAPTWKVRAGVAYDKSPVDDEFRTPRLPDDDRTWVSGGLQWAFAGNGAIDVGLAHLFVSEPSSNLPNVDPAPPTGFQATPKGALVGTYDAAVWIGAVQARYSF